MTSLCHSQLTFHNQYHPCRATTESDVWSMPCTASIDPLMKERMTDDGYSDEEQEKA